MDGLWLVLMVGAWVALLKWVFPRFKLSGCSSDRCGSHPAELRDPAARSRAAVAAPLAATDPPPGP